MQVFCLLWCLTNLYIKLYFRSNLRMELTYRAFDVSFYWSVYMDVDRWFESIISHQSVLNLCQNTPHLRPLK